MKKPDGNWQDKKPDTGERLAARFSIHSASWADSLGGSPELTTADFAAAVGGLKDPFAQIVLGARYGDWLSDQVQLKEAVLRRSWFDWHEKKRQGNMNTLLNEALVDLALLDWCLTLEQRQAVADTYRASKLNVGYRRFKDELKEHEKDLVGWLDVETSAALASVARRLRK